MNPLLTETFEIPFDRLRPEHVEPGIREALEVAQRELDELLAFKGKRTYANTVQALDELDERLSRAVGLGYHLMAVANSPELRAGFNAVLPEFSAFFAKLPLNAALWRAVKEVAESGEAEMLDPVRRRRLEKLVREFRRAGADLPDAQKARVEAINVELSRLHNKFSENVLDATNAFELLVSDESELAGLPEGARARAKESAQAKGKEGWRFTLHEPSYQPLMKHADSRELRRTLYEAFVGRGGEGEWDNRPLIRDILKLRRELARLLGYRDFADYRLEVNMAGSGEAALRFVEALFDKTLPHFRREIAALERFARDELGIARLEPYDVLYAFERQRQAEFALDQEVLRPYFPVDRVLQGMFEIAERLFGIEVREVEGLPVWHPEVRTFEVRDQDGVHLGSFYADLYPRESKRAGAWKNGLVTGGPSASGFDPHLAVIAANFTPPSQADEQTPALLTFDEVTTTFHEFGHLLHHMLSRVEVRALAGTRVPRDWVELPSQLMENWAWEKEALELFARHYQTLEPLPDELFAKMQRARTHMEAYKQMRQLSFAKVDLALHIAFDPDIGSDPIAFGQRVMEPFQIRPEFAHNNFLAHFQHVFSGGYAAGYYSYKWSEVLDADAFTRFQQEGIFNAEVGRALVETILSRGDSVPPAEQFRAFMGRDPKLDALLRRTFGVADAVGA